MGLFDAIRKQFIDVLEWLEQDDGVLAWRYPMQDNEIQTGASLTVRESQLALFVDEGQVADTFAPGRYTLDTSILPILTNLKHWDKGFEAPFKSDVYFFSTRDQLDLRWGTPQPITFRDKEYGPIRMRAFGTYSFRIEDPRTFHVKVSGTRSPYRVGDLEGQIRANIITTMTSFLASSGVPFLDMAANLGAFSANLQQAIQPVFAGYGLKLESFLVQNVSLPKELEEALDKASKMRMVGNLNKYAKYQAAEALPEAAKADGGLAGAGAGLGAGMAMGNVMGQALGGIGGGGGGGDSSEDAFAKLEKLHSLVEKGIITQEDFDRKKAELLADI